MSSRDCYFQHFFWNYTYANLKIFSQWGRIKCMYPVTLKNRELDFFTKVFSPGWLSVLTFSWRRPLSYRNQSIDLRSKSMDWFLCDNGLRYVKGTFHSKPTLRMVPSQYFKLFSTLKIWLEIFHKVKN